MGKLITQAEYLKVCNEIIAKDISDDEKMFELLNYAATVDIIKYINESKL